MLKLKCDLRLSFQLAQDQNDIVEIEVIQNAQKDAYDKIKKCFNKFEITMGDWDGNTGIDIGYIETIDFTLTGNEELFNNIYKELECLKNEIDDCEYLEITDAEIENEEEIVDKIKEQLLNETVSIKIMEEIVENIMNYDDEGKILREECSDKENTYCYNFYVLGGNYQEFILSIDWEVVKYEEDREENMEMYNRIIRITNIETI